MRIIASSCVVVTKLSLIIIILVLGIFPVCVWCEKDKDDGDKSSGGSKSIGGTSPALIPLVTSFAYTQFSNMTKYYRKDIEKALGFCILDVDTDVDGAFNFTHRDEFMANCYRETKDLQKRLCTAAELKFYFMSYFEKSKDATSHFLKPNKNCNLTSWAAGCEPGWASAANKNVTVEFKNSREMPARTSDSKECCEGFFCPQGLTCMIPCPLGAYCPRATLNKTTGVCDPYNYQLPPGNASHGCGGADMWGPSQMGTELFCSAGSYCPTTIEKKPCSRGHYCRMGSMDQKLCFKLSTCDPNTSLPNMHFFGIMLIGALSGILIVIYNCSDQVISTRYERQAKSREAAAKYARETAQARERWKSAKDIAKKTKASGFQGLQQQFSRTFSKKTSTVKDAQMKSNPLPPTGSSAAPGKKTEPGDLTKMLQSFDDNSESNEGFNLEIGDKNIKKQMPKGKKALQTKSQIFKYAYGQLEKEKAMEEKNKNLTFSGVISMAKDIDEEDVRRRPRIEVAFKELTLTLKGKNKHIMRSVSGKIMPGRISAVMGPSGAGKTTFLSALAGKVRGCTMTGNILINGKSESIHWYKKIIGFVPQDDIVHGNLTVEENLRFSARCRLSADMPKADKVLIVERVIESLGLQGVRDSLVGTVEKRGISGGQRKRVNVGLEMVMEPSLLILDEPTSGLDSASSSLLLRALRREALEGVNICMVVHQPSYSLYKMFDDLILLAKGGLTVYHGSVKKVEEYFSGVGITVPERVNPPDHLIDILEGIVKPGPGVTIQQLPVRWMLHNGYPVPPDMMQLLDQIGTSSAPLSTNPNPDPAQEQSFAGELFQDMAHHLEVMRDHLEHNFLSANDLSNRVTPGVFRQYRYFLGRLGKQRLREARIQAADFLILLLAGACLGTLSKVSDDTFGATGYTYTVIAVSLLCKIAALRSFAMDKLHYMRESASGINSLAYFMSKDTIDHFNTLVKPVVYLSMFYFFNYPRSSFGSNYLVLVCLVYCVTGMAYALAIFLEFSQAQLWSVLLPVVLTLIANQDKDEFVGKHIANFCYPKWALEAFVIANAKNYSGVWLMTRCGALMQSGYDLHHWNRCLIFLVASGIACRVIAFVCLVGKGKK